MGIPLSRWKREALATPHLGILQAALDKLTKGEEHFVFRALANALREVCVTEVQEGGCDEFRPADDVWAHYNLTVKSYFFDRQKGYLWLGGKRKIDVERRANLLAAFIEECKAAGAKKAEEEAAKSIKWTFRAYIGGHPEVRKLEVTAETKTRISWVDPAARATSAEQAVAAAEPVTEAKEGAKHAHFATWAEAHEWIKAYAATQLADARRVLQLAQTYDGQARGLREHRKPKVVKEAQQDNAEGAKEVPDTAERTASVIAAVEADAHGKLSADDITVNVLTD